MKNILVIFSILFFSPFTAGQEIPENIKVFFEKLINDDVTITEHVSVDALDKSERLRINYAGIRNKFLISYDIDPSLKKLIQQKSVNYFLTMESFPDNYFKIILSTDTLNFAKEFFFKDSKLISRIDFYTRDWTTFNSKYLRVKTDNPVFFNEYSLRKMDDFIEALLNFLKVDSNRKDLLAREKINYILCNDEIEIKALSGHQSRGIYILAYDEIITTFNTHYHELAHLIINFKLQNLPLYTLPFFQEGFASALGGRGGIGRDVILNTGYFLETSGMINFNSILTKKNFQSEDASMTYPVSGLYNYFLLSTLGGINYLDLYSTYSGSEKNISDLNEPDIFLPSVEEYENFLSNFNQSPLIKLDKEHDEFDKNYYFFKVRSNVLLSPHERIKNFISKKFTEIYPETEYKGEKYLIKASNREVSVYNLYTNTLIAFYNAGISLDEKEVPYSDGYFHFHIRKDVFDEDKENLVITEF
jgi:hypothetical protein